jgi:hypothetical protein
MTETNETEKQAAPSGDIVATGDWWYRGKMLIMGLALIIYCGGFFLYDGFVGWPNRNAHIAELEKQRDATKTEAERDQISVEIQKTGAHKSDFDIMLQRVIGFVAIPLGLFVLINSIRKSRGEIRLSGETLHVPGHPPITLDSITEIDQRLWDRKGIAYVSYSLPEGQNGKLTLDDYIYKRGPIDAIYKRITDYITPQEEPTSDASAERETP